MVVPREEDESEGVDALMRAARARASPGRSHTCQDTVRQDVYGRRTGGVVQIRRERHSEDDESESRRMVALLKERQELCAVAPSKQ